MDAKSIEFDSLLSVSRDKAMKNREEARNYISIDLGNLARILSQYHPLEIIKMAYWEERRVARTTKDESLKEAARLMPVVLQSVVQSTLFKPHSYLRDVRKKDWLRVQSICQDIQRKLNRYIDFQMVMEYLDGKVTEDNLERYRKSVHKQFFPASVNEEKLHMKTEFAKACMDGESPFFKERFGIGVGVIGDEIEKIVRYSLNCIDELRDESSVHKTMMLLAMANLKTKAGNQNLTDNELRALALKDPVMRQQNQKLQGLRDDYDMFRPDFVSDLPTSFYRELSSEPGTLDMDDFLFCKGLWPSASFPFVDFGGMYFTFMGKSLLGITQMVLKTRFNLGQRLAVASESILSSVLKPTDVDGVYSYEGEKIDVETLCPLGEVNAYRFPELFQSRSERRKSEMIPHAMPGHIALILDPDGTRGVEKLSEGAFFTSLAHLLEIRNDREQRIAFYRFILPNAGIDKLDEKLEFSELEEDILASPVEETPDDIQDEELTLDALDEPETIDDTAVADDLDEDEPAPEVSLYEVPEEEIRENERIYRENQDLIENALEKQPVVIKDFLDKDLEDDFYQKPDQNADDVIDYDESEDELESALDEPETIDDTAVSDDLDDDEEESDDQLDFLEILDDEDLVDDTDEDEVFADETVIEPVQNPVTVSEIETEKMDDDLQFRDEEEVIAPVENEVLGTEIETEDRDDDDIEEETGVIPESEIIEPVRDESVVEEKQTETYEQEPVKEKYVPDPAIMRKLFGLDDDDDEPQKTIADAMAEDEDEESETVADFFKLDEDDIDDSEEKEDENVAPSTDGNAEFFGFADSAEPVAEDVEETSPEVEEPVDKEETFPEEDDSSELEDALEDEGPTFVLDDPSLIEETPEKEPVVDETSSEEEKVEEPAAEDALFTLLDPAEDEEEEDEIPSPEPEPAEEVEEEKSSSILLGGSEIVDETPDEEDEDVPVELESDDEQEELPLFDEPKEDTVQIPEMSDVVDLKDDDTVTDEEVKAEDESSDEELSGEGETLDGDIVLEYYDEEEDKEEEKEDVAAEVVLSDEKEADARERVFTLSEEDVRESTQARTPVSAYIDPEENEEKKTEEESHTVDLGNPKYSETIRQIASLLSPDLGVFGSFIEKEDRSVLDYFNTVIKQCWERQCQDGKDKMFSIFEYDMSILLAKSKVYDALRENELMNNAGAVMYSKGKTEWNALILYVNKDYKVESVELRKITKDDFSASNWKIVTVIGEELIARGQR